MVPPPLLLPLQHTNTLRCESVSVSFGFKYKCTLNFSMRFFCVSPLSLQVGAQRTRTKNAIERSIKVIFAKSRWLASAMLIETSEQWTHIWLSAPRGDAIHFSRGIFSFLAFAVIQVEFWLASNLHIDVNRHELIRTSFCMWSTTNNE